MNTMWKLLLSVFGLAFAAHAAAQITFYEGENFRGHSFSASQAVQDFQPTGFNDRAQSAVVDAGSWQVCVDAGFEGRCAVLRPGSYPSLRAMGMSKNISSVRPVDWDGRYESQAPAPSPRTAGLCLSRASWRAAVRGAGYLGARRDGPAGAALLGGAAAGRQQ